MVRLSEGSTDMGQLPPELIGRAVQDADFRRRLLDDPQQVVKAEGYELEPDQIEALQRLDPRAIDEAIDALIGDVDAAKWG
jgi:hypothetical protein